MFVKCDSCSKKFKFKNPKKRKINDQISEIYFECPNCGEEFHSYYENEKVRELMIDSRKLQNKLKQDITKSKFDSLIEKIKYNKKRIDKEQKFIEKKGIL